ncbi:MAG: J domain-containing protein [Sphaerobacter sp.]|nr:J domain-containing protein [Sphaerobacter sp.]
MARPGARFDPEINYYEVLNVPYTATRAEITRAYRTLMRAVHPDRAATAQERAKAEERAKLLNAAYAVLGKPEVRRDYDAAIRHRAIADALMQRYTGNVPGRPSPVMTRPPVSPQMVRAQRRASRSALLHFVVITVLFVAALVAVVLLASLLPQAVQALVG